MANALANATCERCKGGFAPAEKIVNSNGELYHEPCFVCAQCFQQFPEGLFYEVGAQAPASPSPQGSSIPSVLTWEIVPECLTDRQSRPSFHLRFQGTPRYP